MILLMAISRVRFFRLQISDMKRTTKRVLYPIKLIADCLILHSIWTTDNDSQGWMIPVMAIPCIQVGVW
jgi:hypothetical protein